jgi:hypothetical protein
MVGTGDHQPLMANLTPPEFTEAITLLAGHFGLERLRDRMAAMKAFTTRRGMNTPQALADRVYRLSGGLRLQSVPTFAFTALWGEMLTAKLGEDGEKKLEELAEKVNACLTEQETIVEGKEAEIDAALEAYRAALADGADAEIARLDMLLKAVPDVALRLRGASPG